MSKIKCNNNPLQTYYKWKTNVVLEVEKQPVNYDVPLQKQVFIILKTILKEEESRPKHWPKNSFCGEINGIDFFHATKAHFHRISSGGNLVFVDQIKNQTEFHLISVIYLADQLLQVRKLQKVMVVSSILPKTNKFPNFCNGI